MWSNSCILTVVRRRDQKTFCTVFTLGCIIIGFLLAYTAFGNLSTSVATLELVHIVFRHGERTPTTLYPTDPHKLWTEGLGELTNKGKQQLYDLGKKLRKRYSGFLSDLYSIKDLTVKSSYIARCQMSAMTLLAGLYPPIGNQIWNPELLWQPIPANPIPRNVDNLIASKADCPVFNREKLKSDEELLNETAEANQELFKYLSQHTGKPITNIADVEFLYSTLLIEKENNLPLPSWTETVFPEPMRKLAALNLLSYTRTDILKRLQAGPLLGEWVTHMKNVQDKEGGISKLYLYSGHDLTLVNSLRGLGISEPILPNYGAALVIELHSEEDYYYVEVFLYDSSSSVEPKKLSIPGCGSVCTLNTFMSLTEPFIPRNWPEECSSNK